MSAKESSFCVILSQFPLIEHKLIRDKDGISSSISIPRCYNDMKNECIMYDGLPISDPYLLVQNIQLSVIDAYTDSKVFPTSGFKEGSDH